MTELLEKAISQVKQLAHEKQDAIFLRKGLAIALLILEELEDEAKWDASFASSQTLLESMAAEAMAEHKAGKTQESAETTGL
ncbi:MAG: hypothetical protein AAGN15_23450 [Cyanobacteria bacterium J06581_3]